MESLKENLIRRGYLVSVFETAKEAAEYIDGAVDGVSVGIGGSVTANQLSLLPMLKRHNTVYSHSDEELVKKVGVSAARSLAATTDVYISSVNAISADGVIVNIDGTGNRIASTLFGHKKVYLIIGKNKITDTFYSALGRAKNVAAPKNAMRLCKNTPCAAKGDRCYDCDSPDRICRAILITERPTFGTETEVVLVNEELGY